MNRMHDREGHKYPCDESMIYRIRIRGALDERWSTFLGGMRITTSRVGDHEVVTTLSGQLRDQAALVGVINALYDMHLPILQVECLDQDVAD